MSKDNNQQPSIEASLKSGDTEEWLDIVFTRRVGYAWTLFFKSLGIHPNVVTVLSIILGVGAAWFFMHDADTTRGLVLNIVGVLLLMWANFYDSCDGQLARLTGQKTRLGRILDGAAGDIWFFCIYVAISLRMYHHPIPLTTTEWGLWGFALCIVAGTVCHARQCSLSDYYRNIHLFFLRGRSGSELDTYSAQRELLSATRWKDGVLWRFFLWTYVRYTHGQEQQTPEFQRMMTLVRQKWPDVAPEAFRRDFRKRSLPMMKWANILTFNTRAIALYVACLADMPYVYPLFEIFVLTALYLYMRHTHEAFCRQFTHDIENGKY